MSAPVFSPLKQAFPDHDPASGVHGDCLRTSIAMMMGLEREQVPHFITYSDWLFILEDWLEERGYGVVRLPLFMTLDEALIYLGRVCPRVPVLLSGISPRGFHHAVVVFNGILFDPSPYGGGVAHDEKGAFRIWIISPRMEAAHSRLTEASLQAQAEAADDR